MQKEYKEIMISWEKNEDATLPLGTSNINCRNIISIIYIFICSSNFSSDYWHFQTITQKHSGTVPVLHVL